MGRASVRRRHRLGVAGATASLAVLAGLMVAAVTRGDTQPQPSPTPPTPSTSAGAKPTTAGIWAASLPRGNPPEVPYLAGTTVVQPDGTRIEVPGETAQTVGQTVAGLVLLVGSVNADGDPSDSHYVLVRTSGEAEDLPISTLSADGTREAVVSPDGRRLAGGGEILDMADLSVVGQVPSEAKLLIAWTPVGIVYLAEGGDFVLWPEGGTPITLRSNPGEFATGSDVAIDVCSNVVRLTADGTITRLSSGCGRGLWSVSASGRWAITPDLRIIDVATGVARRFSDRRATVAYRYQNVWWDGDQSVLFPADDWLVRCYVDTATCEQIAGPENSLSLP